ARNEEHGIRVIQEPQGFVPLPHLVDVHITVGEVHSHAVPVQRQRAALFDAIPHCEQRSATLEHFFRKAHRPLGVGLDLHPTRLPAAAWEDVGMDLSDLPEQPAVSYVMPVLNEEAYLEEAVRTILSQDYEGEK